MMNINALRNISSSSLKKLAVAATMAIVVVGGLGSAARAATASQLAATINATIDLSASVSGSTVTVTGTLGATPSGSDFLTLNIDAGVTVIWRASLQGNPSGSYALINLSGGSGTFRMESGLIGNTGAGRAITNNSSGAVNIQGGTVSATTGNAIHNASTGAVNIQGGTVSATTGNAIHNASTGAVSISRGTVRATTSNAIYNASTGVITISGTGMVTSANVNHPQALGGPPGTIFLNNSGIATEIRLQITGGTVENTSTEPSSRTISTHTIYNASTGAINVSGGTVRGSGNAYEILNGSTGTITISGGIVGAIYSTNSSSIINISGGTVGTTTSSGTVNVSGTARIATAQTNSNRGTLELLGSSAKLNMTGGTVENTGGATSSNAIYDSLGVITISGGTVSGGRAIYVNSTSGTVNVTGGTISTPLSSGYAIYTGTNVTTTLGGNPTITGRIYTHTEKFEVLTSGASAFAPGDNKVYTLEFPEYVASRIAVTNGRNFIANFTLYSSSWALTAVGAGSHLAIAVAVRVVFDLNGGTGTTPATISVASGNTLPANRKPATTDFTRTGHTNDGNWYTTSVGTTEFIFGASGIGTPVTSNTMLYLKWTPATYTVTYNLNSGTQQSGTWNSYTYGTGLTLPTSPIREGYIFGGWYTSSGLTGTAVTMISTTDTGNKTYWAKWIPIRIVTFNPNGGTVTPESGTTEADSTLASLPTPTRDGYIFADWFTAATGGTVVALSRKYTANTIIYARWVPIYTITFDANGGTVTPESGTTGVDSTLASLPTPTKTGYTFNGWFTEETDGEEVTTSTAFDGNATIYAQWSLLVNAVIPTITVQPVGGTVTVGTSHTFTVSASVNDGGTLSYQWYRNTSASNSGGAPISGATSASYTPSTAADGTFYYYVVVTNTNEYAPENKTATITSNAVTLTVNAQVAGSRSVTVLMRDGGGDGWNGSALRINVNGTNRSPNLTFSYLGDTYTSTFNVNTGDVVQIYWVRGTNWWSECAFAIYYTDNPPNPAFNPVSDSTNDAQRILISRLYGSLTNTSSGTLLGSFTVIGSYDVSFNLNGGTGTAPASIIGITSGSRLAASQSPSISEISKSGSYSDGKWYIDHDGTTEFVFHATTGTAVMSNWTLYPKWLPAYTVTFDAGEGEVDPESALTTGVGGTLTSLPTPTRIGYTFDDWFTAAIGGDTVTTSTVFVANDTIYAQWTIIDYTITYDLDSGVVSTDNPSIYTVLTPTFTLTNPTKTGYTFTGWTGTDITDTLETVMIDSGSVGNRTYTAQYAIKTYTVTFVNQDTTLRTVTVNHGSAATAPTSPTRAGYNFTGWDVAFDNVTSNLTVTAQWMLIVHAETPIIATQPIDDTVTVGTTGTTLSVSASVSDGGVLSYQWYSNTSASNTGGTLITGATSATYSPSTAAAGTFYYYVVVTNTNSSVNGNTTAATTSDVVTLVVLDPPPPTYTLTVQNGGLGFEGNGTYKAGDTVVISSGMPSADMRFVRWTSTGFNIPASVENVGKTVIIMPSSNVTLTANWEAVTAARVDFTFAAGSNIVNKASLGKVAFFVSDSGASLSKSAANLSVGGTIIIYDAMGNVVRRLNVKSSDRQVAEWDLKDSKGRLVADGTYLARGVLTVNGKREKVSAKIAVR